MNLGVGDQYLCETSLRMSTCKGCNQRLPGGEVRLSRLRGAQKVIFHPACFFQLLDRISPNTRVIQGPDDLSGLSSLPPGDQAMLRTLVQSHLDTRTTTTTLPASPTGSHSSTAGPGPSDTSTPRPKRPRLAAPHLISDEDEEDGQTDDVPPVPAGQSPRLPDLLAGVTIPEGPPRTYDECSVCLDIPVHPVTLPCSHIFCYLCAKGLASVGMTASCSLCRRDIPDGYLESASVLRKASQELNDTPPLEASEDWQWFYEGRNGWWRFETRNNDELEEGLRSGLKTIETLICGNIYVMDLVLMEQYQKDRPNRKRRMKRDVKSSQCKGVAGLGKRSWAQTSSQSS